MSYKDDHSTKILKDLLKEVKKMSVEDYKKLYDEMKKDMEENHIEPKTVITDSKIIKKFLKKERKKRNK